MVAAHEEWVLPLRRIALATLAFASVAVWALFVAGGPSAPDAAHAQPPQAALTASYSIIGGTGFNVQDNLTYVSDGDKLSVPLTGSPTVYMADTGTPWSVQTTLTGSTIFERWITNQDVSGSIGAPLTVSFSYYHQYLVNFDYNVTDGASGSTGPTVNYNQMGAPASSSAPALVWVDASSPFSYASQLPGSNSNERWILASGGSGTVGQAATIVETYYHEFLVSTSFSIVNGGAPTPPALSSTALGAPAALDMTSFTQTIWLDAGANYTFTAPLTETGQSANETWIGTVLLPTQNGNVLSMDNNGTVFGPISITPVYYHQFFVSVKFNLVGGTLDGLTPPAFTYDYFGNKTSVSNDTAVWVDSGTQYTVPQNICCTNLSLDRWQIYNATSGTISAPTTISTTYFHQYFESFSYSISGQQPASPSGQPELTYLQGGDALHLTLLLTPQAFWADANSSYSATSSLSASNQTERWFSQTATGSFIEPPPYNSVDIAYVQQYLVTMVGGGLPTEWLNAGNNATVSAPGVYGRSAGTGYRIISYQVDSGSTVLVSSPTTLLFIPLSMNGPHTIAFQSVRQFQVSLDQGAAGALHFITPPTATGDDYWYDSGSPVQVVLSGTWGRADGIGHRITSIFASGEPTLPVDTVGTVQAYFTSSLISPVSITTTSITQYEVVLNGGAFSSFSSISPPSTFPNDTFWYDSGSPAVTLMLHGAYSRSAGTGTRTTSWELDSGPVTKVAQTGPITIVTNAMTAAQFVNATTVTQYQVTLDAGASTAIASITSPSVPLDSGWYDASAPVGLVLNGAWGRSAGTGHRLAGYSLNAGSEVAVASAGLVDVLNLAGISSPEAVTTMVVTQYQVTLDSGASSSLSSITPTPIPNDKYWYDAGTSVSASLNGVWGRTAVTGDRLLSYSVNQGATTSVLSSSPVQVLSVPAIAGPQSVTTKTSTQFHVASPVAWVSITNSSIPGDAAGWFDAATKVNVVFGSVWGQTSAGSRESVTSYTINGAGKTSVTRSGNGTFSIALSMTQGQVITLTSVTQYLLTVVGPPQVTTSPPSPTGDSYFDSGSKVTITVPRAWNGTSGSGTQETLVSYSLDGASATSVPFSNSSAFFTPSVLAFTQAHTLDFGAMVEYQVSFQFSDGLGTSPVQPSMVQLRVGNSTEDAGGPSIWLENGTSFTIVNVTWEGASVGPEPPPSYQVKAAPLDITLDTQVYQASLKVVDLFGLPVSGAQVSMTLANGTTLTGSTNGKGVFSAGTIPVGTYTARVTSLGTSVRISGDAASGQSVATGKVALSLVSLFVIVAAAAAAGSGGVYVLRMRRRGAQNRVSGPK
ncbi:MAG: carboxypeptidase-like regulatory domain-containing protein [Thaumarchaeota archaeon]|nr:carboxypeptidase-like regulatory domain-containing protein [Nitrososphaerota archaeon]